MKPGRYLVCSSCHAMNASFEATCDQCGAPINLTPEVNSRPATEAVVKRTPPSRLPRKVTLIGIWAIALPNVIAGPVFAFWVLKYMGGLAGFIMFWGSLGLSCIWFFILYRFTRNYFIQGQRPD
jgi:hypothetical protein